MFSWLWGSLILNIVSILFLLCVYSWWGLCLICSLLLFLLSLFFNYRLFLLLFLYWLCFLLLLCFLLMVFFRWSFSFLRDMCIFWWLYFFIFSVLWLSVFWRWNCSAFALVFKWSSLQQIRFIIMYLKWNKNVNNSNDTYLF